MQFSGQDCVKQNESLFSLGHHSSSLLHTYQINVSPTNLLIDVIIFNTHESLLPSVGFTSSQFACCLEGQAENF